MSLLLRRLRPPLAAYSRRLFASESDGKNNSGSDEKAIEEFKSLGAHKKLEIEVPVEGSNIFHGNEFPASDQSFISTVVEPHYIDEPMPPRSEIDPTIAQFRYPQFMIMDHPFRRSAKILKADVDLAKVGRFERYEHEIFPLTTDIVVIGGGIMGASIAHWLKQRSPTSFSMVVIERDPSYTHASTTLSVGGIRQQFSLPENIQMSMFSADFLRNVKKHLSVLDNEPPDLSFCPHGYLFLAGSEAGAEQILANHETQSALGAYIDVLNPDQLQLRFPWLRTDDIIIGANGVQNEGWFDPWSLLVAFKAKAEFHGAQFIHGEVIDFNMKTWMPTKGVSDFEGMQAQTCNHLIVRLPTGEERQIQFAKCIIANGAHSGELTKKLNVGRSGMGLRSVPLPVEPRKRYVYVFHCPDGPGLDFPLLVDPSGVYVRREGLGGNFICGKSPSFEDEPDPSNLDVDYGYFEREIWPVLAHRVKAFENIKLVGAWAGYYDYNTLDQNPVIGYHPYFHNFIWATGFSGHGIQMAPAVGRGVMELTLENHYETLDLTRFGWSRIISNNPYREALIV